MPTLLDRINRLFTDVDGTILYGDKPNQPMIDALTRFHHAHPFTPITVWSRAGKAHAQQAAKLLPFMTYQRSKAIGSLRDGDLAIDDADIMPKKGVAMKPGQAIHQL